MSTLDNAAKTTTSDEGIHAYLKEDKNLIGNSAKLMNNMDGADLSRDMKVCGLNAALSEYKKLVDIKIESADKTQEDWTFSTCPVESLGKTLDDLFISYLYWSQKDDDIEADMYNVTKVLRRMESLAKFCAAESEFLQDIKMDEIEDSYSSFGMMVPKETDSEGRLIWFIDFSKLDREKVKGNETLALRTFWWTMHAIALDPAAKRGVVMVEALGYAGALEMMRLMSVKMQTKLDKLTMGSSAVKMKKVYILQSPWWLSMLMKMMYLFMSSKMRKRVVQLSNEGWGELKEHLGKSNILPSFYEGFDGENIDKFFNKATLKSE